MGEEFLNEFWFVVVEVFGLTRISFEIIELAFTGFSFLSSGFARIRPTAGAVGEDEFVVSFTIGEVTTNAVVNEAFASEFSAFTF